MNEKEILPAEAEECPDEIQREEVGLEEDTEEPYIDYEEELSAIGEELPGCSCCIEVLEGNPRYAELRLLGLTPKEAYLATRVQEKAEDNRSHLRGAVPRGASVPHGQMSRRELDMARSVFGDLDDSEIRRLYKRVTK